MGRNMANPFRWEHLLYGLAGLTIGALLGYFIGVFLMVISISSASFMANTTLAYFFGYRFSNFPIMFTFLAATIGLFIGLVYSHEKDTAQAQQK
jgi:ABC-type lipoprotein release transport system permease subunit